MKKIQSKITLTYLLLAILVVVSLGVISSIKTEAYFKERLINQLSTLVNVVAYLIESGEITIPKQIDYHIKYVSQLENVRISVISLDGVVIADSDVPYEDIGEVENHLNRPEIQEAVSTGEGTDMRRSATVGRDFLYVAKKMEITNLDDAFPSELLIRVAAPLDDLRKSVWEIRLIFIVAGAIVLLIVIGVSLILSRRISKPLVELARDLEEIRSGNLQKHIQVKSQDEIGLVAHTVNSLVDKVRSDFEQMKKLERYRSEFLGNVSHELRTPIFSVQGFIETLLDGAVDDPAVNRDFLKKAYSHASRLNNLLGDLINISQIETGEMKLNLHSFPVMEFIDGIVREMQTFAEQHHVRLKAKIVGAENSNILGDKQRLLQVMRNLIQNGIVYNKPYGEVIVSCERLQNTVKISVADTGIGIAKEHLPRIFERFYRVDRDRSREVGGTGLGLAIVKHIIEAHGSKVQVKSTVGMGSVFWFELKEG